MEHTGGYECKLFLHGAPEDLTCSICLMVAADPHVTEACGHLFCRSCVFTALEVKAECPNCRKELHVDQIRKDIRAQRQIASLAVQCGNEGCEWKGILGGYESHLQKCAFVPKACPFADHGCAAVVSSPSFAAHLNDDLPKHLLMVCEALSKSQKKIAEMEQQQGMLVQTIAALRSDVKACRQQLRQQEDDAKAGQAEAEQTIALLRSEITHLRHHMGNAPPLGVPSLRWCDGYCAGKFTISEDGKEATHITPGWSTLLCAEGFSRGKHTWGVRILPLPADEYISSTVMIGVTSSTTVSSRHLGNVERSWCFQDNGFRWDGTQCFAYGDQCSVGDVIGVVLDLDDGTISFSRNGVSMGVAFTGIGGMMYPAVSLCTKGQSVHLVQ